MQDPAVLERRERSSFRRTSSHSPVRRAARPVFRFSFSFSLLHPPCSFPCAFFPVRLSLSTFVQYFWSFLPSPWQRSLCAVPAGQGASSGSCPVTHSLSRNVPVPVFSFSQRIRKKRLTLRARYAFPSGQYFCKSQELLLISHDCRQLSPVAP